MFFFSIFLLFFFFKENAWIQKALTLVNPLHYDTRFMNYGVDSAKMGTISTVKINWNSNHSFVLYGRLWYHANSYNALKILRWLFLYSALYNKMRELPVFTLVQHSMHDMQHIIHITEFNTAILLLQFAIRAFHKDILLS